MVCILDDWGMAGISIRHCTGLVALNNRLPDADRPGLFNHV